MFVCVPDQVAMCRSLRNLSFGRSRMTFLPTNGTPARALE